MEEPWPLVFRIAVRGGDEMENEVADGTITATRTCGAMVAELLQSAVS